MLVTDTDSTDEGLTIHWSAPPVFHFGTYLQVKKISFTTSHFERPIWVLFLGQWPSRLITLEYLIEMLLSPGRRWFQPLRAHEMLLQCVIKWLWLAFWRWYCKKRKFYYVHGELILRGFWLLEIGHCIFDQWSNSQKPRSISYPEHTRNSYVRKSNDFFLIRKRWYRKLHGQRTHVS